jgi:uncharacterized protein YbjQ (UPF0145 family)
MVSLTAELPGHRVVENIGVVRGIVVRSRSVVGNIAGAIQTLFGGNITVYTNLCEQARMQAYDMMCDQAAANGANAVVMMRYDLAMSAGLLDGFALFAAGAAAALAQLWLQVWSPETFFKLMATDGVLLALVVAAAFLLRERRETQRLRDRKQLD